MHEAVAPLTPSRGLTSAYDYKLMATSAGNPCRTPTSSTPALKRAWNSRLPAEGASVGEQRLVACGCEAAPIRQGRSSHFSKPRGFVRVQGLRWQDHIRVCGPERREYALNTGACNPEGDFIHELQIRMAQWEMLHRFQSKHKMRHGPLPGDHLQATLLAAIQVADLDFTVSEDEQAEVWQFNAASQPGIPTCCTDATLHVARLP